MINQPVLNKVLTGHILHAMLELTDRCNHSCSFCYAGCDTHQPKGFFTLSDWCNTIDDLVELGCEQISLAGGEPTLFKELPELLDYAAENGIQRFDLLTNGSNTTEFLLETLVKHDVDIAVSLHGPNPETQDAITRRPGSFDAAVLFIKMCLQNGLRVRAGAVSCAINKEHLLAVFNLLKSLGVEDVTYDLIRESESGKTEKQNGEKTRPALGRDCVNCISDHLCIGADGTVYPCPVSRNYVLGDLSHQALVSIVQSRRRANVVTELVEIASTTEIPEGPFESLTNGSNFCPTKYCNPGKC